MIWKKGFAEWTIGDTAYLSIVFSWDADAAYQRAVYLRASGYDVKVGGPGAWHPKQRSIFESVAEFGEHYPEAVLKHNANATFASHGCPVNCYFCDVSKREGKGFTIHCDFQPRPILCDNNLSALNPAYQDFIIAKYREYGVKLRDANSGFEPLTFTDEVYRRWRPLIREGGGPWRFAFDTTSERPQFLEMTKILKDEPRRSKRVYVLIGNEPFEDCMRRIDETIAAGCDPYCQAVMKPNTFTKTPWVRYDWTMQRLRDVQRWVNRYGFRSFPFSAYDGRVRQPRGYKEEHEQLAIL